MSKVAFFADHIAEWQAGTEGQMLMLAKGLVEKGWTVPLFIFRDSGAAQDGRWPGSVTDLDITSMASPSNWLKAIRVARSLRAAGYRLAHLYFSDTSILLPPFFRMLGIKIIVSRRDMGFWYTPVRLFLLRINRFFTNYVVANCNAVRDVARECEKYQEKKIAVIFNGFEKTDSTKGQGRRRLRRADHQSTYTVGILANLRPIKRIDDVIRAIALLQQSAGELEINLLVAGADRPGRCGPSHKLELENIAAELGISDKITFFGSTSDARSFLDRCDIGVLVSETEGLSNTVIEYLAHGLPAVVSRAGGNDEIVLDNVNGYVVKVGDIQGLSDRMRELLKDKEKRLRFGQQGIDRVAEKFSADKMFGRYEMIYQELLAE